jgi:small subunit ribosomal protein S16
MSVQIRLSRLGRKKLPFYRLVAAEKGAKRDGRFIEVLGTFSPSETPAKVNFKADRIKAWIEVGAECSDTASELIEKEIPGYLSEIVAGRTKKLQAKRKARKARVKKTS